MGYIGYDYKEENYKGFTLSFTKKDFGNRVNVTGYLHFNKSNSVIEVEAKTKEEAFMKLKSIINNPNKHYDKWVLEKVYPELIKR